MSTRSSARWRRRRPRRRPRPPAGPAAPATTAAPAAAPAPGQAPVTEAQLNEAVGQVRNEILTEMAEKDEAAISIWVTLEGEVRWRRYGNLGDRNSGSTSDIFLRDAEIGLEFKPTDYLTGKLVLKSEYLGSDTTDGGGEADSAVVVDEATITFEQEDGFPLYFVIGKRTQPFGALLRAPRHGHALQGRLRGESGRGHPRLQEPVAGGGSTRRSPPTGRKS